MRRGNIWKRCSKERVKGTAGGFQRGWIRRRKSEWNKKLKKEGKRGKRRKSLLRRCRRRGKSRGRRRGRSGFSKSWRRWMRTIKSTTKIYKIRVSIWINPIRNLWTFNSILEVALKIRTRRDLILERPWILRGVRSLAPRLARRVSRSIRARGKFK